MEKMYEGSYSKVEKDLLKKTIEAYSEKDIVADIIITIEGYLSAIPEIGDDPKFKNTQKTFSESMKGMLMSALKIDRIANDENLGLFEKNSDIKVFLEHFIFSFRKLFENLSLIFDKAVVLNVENYKKEEGINNDKRISNFKKSSLKLEYIDFIISHYELGSNPVNKDIFESLRGIRNDLIHGNASSQVYQNGSEPLFQLYTLDVDDLLDPRDFYSSVNLISCKYFIVTRCVYMINFIKQVFGALRDPFIVKCIPTNYCSVKYFPPTERTEYENSINFNPMLTNSLSQVHEDQLKFFKICKSYL